MFTVDPSTGDRSPLVIEAAWGLGEVVVGGLVEPDTYTVDRGAHRVRQVRIGHQGFRSCGGPRSDRRGRAERGGPGAGARRRSGSSSCAGIGVAVEEHYEQPQDIELAMEDDKLFLVQARPITTLMGGIAAGGRRGRSVGDAPRGARHRAGGLARCRGRKGSGACGLSDQGRTCSTARCSWPR